MNNQLSPLWSEWLQFRKAQGWKSYATQRSQEALQAFSTDIQTKAINASMDNCWQGLFPEKINNSNIDKIKSGVESAMENDSDLYKYIAVQFTRMRALAFSFPPAADLTEMSIAAFYDAMVKRKLGDEDIFRLRSDFDAYVMEETDWPKPADILRRLPPKIKTAPALPPISKGQRLENIKRLNKLISTMGIFK